MSKYSPTVLPEPFDFSALADAFLRSTELRRQRQREQEADKHTRLIRAAERYRAGIRDGAPPPDEGTTLELPGEPDIPDRLDFANAFMPETPRRAGRPFDEQPSALDPESLADYFLEDIRGGRPRGRGAATPADDADSALDGDAFSPEHMAEAFRTAEVPEMRRLRPPRDRSDDESRALPASLHPGAFNLETGTFGGGPLQQAPRGRTNRARTFHLPPTGRGVRLDDEHYLDLLATPEEQARMLREEEESRRRGQQLDAESRADTRRREAEQRGEERRIAQERRRLEAEASERDRRNRALWTSVRLMHPSSVQLREYDPNVDYGAVLQETRAHESASQRTSPEDALDRERRGFLRQRMTFYMTPRYNPLTGDLIDGTGLPRDQAAVRAQEDADAVFGGSTSAAAGTRSPATPPTAPRDSVISPGGTWLGPDPDAGARSRAAAGPRAEIPAEWIEAAKKDPEYRAYLERLGVRIP